MRTQKKYPVILADPPWHYKVYSKKGAGRSAESHYPTMETSDIMALPVADIAAEDSARFCGLHSHACRKGWKF